MRYLFRKKLQKSSQRWGLCPQCSVGFRRLGLRSRPHVVVLIICCCNVLQTLGSDVISLYYCYKRAKCAYFPIFDVGLKIYCTPGGNVHSYATDNITSLNVTSFSPPSFANVFCAGASGYRCWIIKGVGRKNSIAGKRKPRSSNSTPR